MAGRVTAGPLVRLACERHQRDQKSRGIWGFSEPHADRVIQFFETVLSLPDADDADGNPRPFLLQPWQVFIIGSLFGWVDEHGYRRFRDVYVEVGKGNGKTPMAAGIGLYGLLVDHEQAAEVYSAATEREQAKICWTDAYRMVERSPALAGRVDLSVGNIKYGHSYFRPLSSEHRGLDGKRPHMALIDELHEHPNGLVTNKIRAGAKGRKQPLFFEITNSGFDRTSVCWQHHEHSRRVLEGTVVDDRWFAYVCGLDEGDDPLVDDACWVKANPNLGQSIHRDYLARQVQNAKNLPNETNTVLRLNFCLWTQAQTRFFDMGKWHECRVAVPDEELAGVPCYGGLDLGQTDDFSALVLIFLLPDDRVAVKCWFWVPAAALLKDRPYAEWQRAGALIVTDGEVTDLDVVERDVYEVCRRFGVRQLGYDKRFAQQLALHLEGQGLVMVDVPQGFYLNEAITRLNEWVITGDLCHGGHPILSWMADNAVVRRGRNGELRLDKEIAREKIDGIVALCMAISRVVVQPQEAPSVYETRALQTIGG